MLQLVPTTVRSSPQLTTLGVDFLKDLSLPLQELLKAFGQVFEDLKGLPP